MRIDYQRGWWNRLQNEVYYTFITEIYIAPLQGYYSEVLLTLAWLKRTVLWMHDDLVTLHPQH